MKALLLAGGYATRLWPLTEDTAKPLLIVGDKPLLSRIVDEIPQKTEIIVSTNHDFAKEFKAWQKEFHPKRNITIFVEPSSRDKQLGALGAISYAIQKFGEDDYLISAGDNIYPFKLSEFLSVNQGYITIAAYDIGDTEKSKKFGVIEIDRSTNRAVGFEEKPNEPKSTLVSTALYFVPKKYLYLLHETAKKTKENIGSFLENAISNKVHIDVYTFKGQWFDIGSFETYIEVHRLLSKNRHDRKEGSNRLIGSIYIHPTAKVENSTLKDSIVLNGSIVTDSHLNQVVVGKNCQLSDIDLEYKSIRDNTRLIGG